MRPPLRRHWRIASVGLVVLAGSLPLAACGSSGSGGVGHAQGSSATITIMNFGYTPDHDTVSPGEKVTVTNKDSVAHTLTSNGGAFNTGRIQPDTSKTIVAPKKSGSYPYHCTIHQYMTGSLVVR